MEKNELTKKIKMKALELGFSKVGITTTDDFRPHFSIWRITMLTWLLSFLNLIVLVMALLFAYESYREGAVRAEKIGLAGAGFHFLLGLAILWIVSMERHLIV